MNFKLFMGTVGATRAVALHGLGWCDKSSEFPELVMDTDGVQGAVGPGDVYLLPMTCGVVQR